MLVIELDEEWARTVRRLAAQTSNSEEDVVKFSICHLEHLLMLAQGETLTFRAQPHTSEADVWLAGLLADDDGRDGD